MDKMLNRVLSSLFEERSRISPPYDELLKEFSYFRALPQAYQILKENGKLNDAPAVFKEVLKNEFNKTLYLNMFINKQLKLILGIFEALAIHTILLKGVYFSGKYFGSIGARPTSDIDLLIKEDQWLLAISSLKKLGFLPSEDEIPGHFHCTLIKSIPQSPIPLQVELHWDIVRTDTSISMIEEIWSRAQLLHERNYIHELSELDEFYMICLHGWRHNLDSLKYFIDIIQLIKKLRNQLDFDLLLKRAKKHHTKKRLIRTLSIVYNSYPYLHKINPFPYSKNVLWKYEWIRRPEKKTFMKYIAFLSYLFFSYDRCKYSLAEFCRWVFPEDYQLKSEAGHDVLKRGKVRAYLSLHSARWRGFIRLK
ncbi:nucleotidyltransferase family protein [Metabacillus sp. KIGAM252]|uniref:Nucleotidyltransferase family protein n=1 Tax=Metabacillus flavus TaxID=2823519 RepID=A0ABS5LFU7_9BACI|nr:nucleotidyltransferase family protein [Metabacillus flavus]MBS2969632.1 nucleotidyltransferase family protein [Metabacillus flavus]